MDTPPSNESDCGAPSPRGPVEIVAVQSTADALYAQAAAHEAHLKTLQDQETATLTRAFFMEQVLQDLEAHPLEQNNRRVPPPLTAASLPPLRHAPEDTMMDVTLPTAGGGMRRVRLSTEGLDDTTAQLYARLHATVASLLDATRRHDTHNGEGEARPDLQHLESLQQFGDERRRSFFRALPYAPPSVPRAASAEDVDDNYPSGSDGSHTVGEELLGDTVSAAVTVVTSRAVSDTIVGQPSQGTPPPHMPNTERLRGGDAESPNRSQATPSPIKRELDFFFPPLHTGSKNRKGGGAGQLQARAEIEELARRRYIHVDEDGNCLEREPTATDILGVIPAQSQHAPPARKSHASKLKRRRVKSPSADDPQSVVSVIRTELDRVEGAGQLPQQTQGQQSPNCTPAQYWDINFPST